jgi:hypothetical protein
MWGMICASKGAKPTRDFGCSQVRQGCDFARLSTPEPWVQGVAGSNPAVPITYEVAGLLSAHGCYFRSRASPLSQRVASQPAPHRTSTPVSTRRAPGRSPGLRQPRLARRKLRRLQIRRHQLPLFVDDGTHGFAIGLGLTVEKTPETFPPADRSDIAHRPVLSLHCPHAAIRMPNSADQLRWPASRSA